MFITQAKEIIEACPSAKMEAKAAEKLVRSIEEEEDSLLEPLLGQDLMLELAEQYALLVAQNGGITTDKMDLQSLDSDSEAYTVQLLRTIQSALVYRMLANKIYSLSTSLNIGAGASRAGAGDYEPADDKHMQELRKEYFMSSRRACDNILVLLERDAKRDEPLWLLLWKDSDSFYLKEDLLFPTIRSMKPYMACDTPTAFIGLCPIIRYCQDTYIAPRIDPDLLSVLLDTSSNLTTNQKSIQKKLRTALAYYVMAKRATKEERTETYQAADNAMSTALAFIEKVNTSTQSSTAQTAETQPTCECPCCQQPEEEYSTFTTLFNPSLSRY